MIKDFLKPFGDIPLENVEKVGKKFYQQSTQLKSEVNSLDDYPVSAGLFLGEIVKNAFIPSPNLLEIINLHSSNKIVLNEKSAWLFICGRDIFIEGIVQTCFSKNVLVLNEKREVLGVAKKEGKTYTNIYDIGSLLRREQQQKRIKK